MRNLLSLRAELDSPAVLRNMVSMLRHRSWRNFLELRLGEVRRISLPGNSVDKIEVASSNVTLGRGDETMNESTGQGERGAASEVISHRGAYSAGTRTSWNSTDFASTEFR